MAFIDIETPHAVSAMPDGDTSGPVVGFFDKRLSDQRLWNCYLLGVLTFITGYHYSPNKLIGVYPNTIGLSYGNHEFNFQALLDDKDFWKFAGEPTSRASPTSYFWMQHNGAMMLYYSKYEVKGTTTWDDACKQFIDGLKAEVKSWGEGGINHYDYSPHNDNGTSKKKARIEASALQNTRAVRNHMIMAGKRRRAEGDGYKLVEHPNSPVRIRNDCTYAKYMVNTVKLGDMPSDMAKQLLGFPSSFRVDNAGPSADPLVVSDETKLALGDCVVPPVAAAIMYRVLLKDTADAPAAGAGMLGVGLQESPAKIGPELPADAIQLLSQRTLSAPAYLQLRKQMIISVFGEELAQYGNYANVYYNQMVAERLTDYRRNVSDFVSANLQALLGVEGAPAAMGGKRNSDGMELDRPSDYFLPVDEGNYNPTAMLNTLRADARFDRIYNWLVQGKLLDDAGNFTIERCVELYMQDGGANASSAFAHFEEAVSRAVKAGYLNSTVTNGVTIYSFARDQDTPTNMDPNKRTFIEGKRNADGYEMTPETMIPKTPSDTGIAHNYYRADMLFKRIYRWAVQGRLIDDTGYFTLQQCLKLDAQDTGLLAWGGVHRQYYGKLFEDAIARAVEAGLLTWIGSDMVDSDGFYIRAYKFAGEVLEHAMSCLLYTSPSPRDRTRSRMPSSA